MLKAIDRDWTNAMVSGSKSAIERYLAEHPDSPFKNIAQHMIDSIDWSVASAAGNVESLEAYIESHPDGEHLEEANDAIKNLNATTVQPEVAGKWRIQQFLPELERTRRGGSYKHNQSGHDKVPR